MRASGGGEAAGAGRAAARARVRRVHPAHSRGSRAVPPAPTRAGTWSTHVIAAGDAWTKVEYAAGGKTAVESVAAAVLPISAARRLLESFVSLKEGASSGWGWGGMR